MRQALLWALLLALSGGFLPAQEDQAIIRTQVEVVNILATVRDRREQYVSDLTKEDFEVYEDGVRQEIEFFNFESGDLAQPLTIVLLIDTSGSVKDKLLFEQQAASEFLDETLRKNKDMAAVIQFDSEINLVQDFTYDYSVLQNAILDIKAGGATKLYDAIYLAIEDLLSHEVGRKVIVVLSDGADTDSIISDKEAIRVAQREDVVIFGIGVHSRMGSDFGKLKEFSEGTGGLFFKSRADLTRLRDAFDVINREIKNQFSIGYIATNKEQDGSFRKITVRLPRKRGLKVTHRKGYYASGPSS